MRTRAGVLCLGGALLCAVPASADAATIGGYEWRGPPEVVYTAGQGEVNDVTVRMLSDGSLLVSDPGKPITIAPDATLPLACVPGVGIAVCRPPGDEQWVRFSAALGDGDDRATVRLGISSSLDGGNGNDTLIGGSDGDALRGGAGRDDLIGGAGQDSVDYSDHAGPVTVTLDGIANDGGPGEADHVAGDVEAVFGTDAADTLVGDGADNDLWGAGGNDRLVGEGGDDNQWGGSGDDIVDGGPGLDLLVGDDGDDTLLAADGERDVLGCGPGNDIAQRDPFDGWLYTTETCETIQEPAG
jgi:Ca2+-binding RTX toxin-like protein